MRPMREAVSKWWDNTEKNHEHFLWTQLQTNPNAEKGMTSGKTLTNTDSDYVCWWALNESQKHRTCSNSVKLQICGQYYLCPWSNYHKAKEWTNSMQAEENQKQSFSSRLPEFLIETHSQDIRQLAICRITLKAQESFNPMALQNVDSSHNQSNILPNNTPCY